MRIRGFPDVVQVAATAGSVTAVCAFFATVVCAFVTVSHTEHFLPSLNPVAEQVASTAGTVTSVCPVALVTVWAWVISVVQALLLKYFLQFEQYQYAVLPSSVQVADFAAVFVVL